MLTGKQLYDIGPWSNLQNGVAEVPSFPTHEIKIFISTILGIVMDTLWVSNHAVLLPSLSWVNFGFVHLSGWFPSGVRRKSTNIFFPDTLLKFLWHCGCWDVILYTCFGPAAVPAKSPLFVCSLPMYFAVWICSFN